MDITFYAAGYTQAQERAVALLEARGIRFARAPGDDVTHLLLPVPSFLTDGSLRGGGDLGALLQQLPKDITVIGGNLNIPALDTYRTVDLMQNAGYVAQNAAITAHCALKIAMEHLPVTLAEQPVLVIGWGRIGKCLARLLQGLDARVTVAARKETDRAMLRALGFSAIDSIHMDVSHYRVIFNTVPQMLLPEGGPGLCIELASRPGIGGEGVVMAPGLPGKEAPESSGKLIADTVMDHIIM